MMITRTGGPELHCQWLKVLSSRSWYDMFPSLKLYYRRHICSLLLPYPLLSSPLSYPHGWLPLNLVGITSTWSCISLCCTWWSVSSMSCNSSHLLVYSYPCVVVSYVVPEFIYATKGILQKWRNVTSEIRLLWNCSISFLLPSPLLPLSLSSLALEKASWHIMRTSRQPTERPMSVGTKPDNHMGNLGNRCSVQMTTGPADA